MRIPWQYSRQVFTAFAVLLVVYMIVLWSLWALQRLGAISFTSDTRGDLLPLLATLPFVALYLVVLIAATAGFARGAVMAKDLPFNQVLRQELQKRTMERSTIRTMIRSAGTVTEDTRYMQALDTVITTRLPIVAVVGADQKVTGVITAHDVLRGLRKELVQDLNGDGKGQKPLLDRILALQVKDLAPKEPVCAVETEDLAAVMGKMIKSQYTKLLVVDTDKDRKFRGAVDVLDLVSQVYEDTEQG